MPQTVHPMPSSAAAPRHGATTNADLVPELASTALDVLGAAAEAETTIPEVSGAAQSSLTKDAAHVASSWVLAQETPKTIEELSHPEISILVREPFSNKKPDLQKFKE